MEAESFNNIGNEVRVKHKRILHGNSFCTKFNMGIIYLYSKIFSQDNCLSTVKCFQDVWMSTVISKYQLEVRIKTLSG